MARSSNRPSIRRHLAYRPLNLRNVTVGYRRGEKKYLWNLHVALVNSPQRHRYNETLRQVHGAYKAAHQWFRKGWRIGKVVQVQKVHKLIKPPSYSKYY